MSTRVLQTAGLCGALLVTAVVANAAPALAGFDTAKWTWQRPVTATVTQTQYVRLPLPLEFLDASLPSLSDLRILNLEGNQTPFVIRKGGRGEAAHLEWKDAQLLNPVFQPGQYSRVTVDLGTTERKNRIRVSTSGENYRRRVLLEGGSDGVKWDILFEDGWLFDVPLPNQHYKIDELTFPLSSFRYLRLTVYNMPDDPRRIDIPSVQTSYWNAPAEPPLLPVEVKAKQSTFDEKEHVSIYDLDLGYKNVPVAAIEAAITDRFYHRAYELAGRNAEKVQTRRQTETRWDVEEHEAPWEPVAHGVLYRMQRDDKVTESNSITGLDVPCRYLRLRVFEQDNPPLTIQSITVKRREVSLVFECRPGETYTLIGGNPEAAPPSFDLATTQSGLTARDLTTAVVGEAQPLEAKTAPGPWNVRYSFVLWVALILAVATTLTLIVRNLGKLRGA